MGAGTTVGKYELLKCLARGATTDLWIARTRGIAGFERHVVIKRCHEQQAQDPSFVQAFTTEARLAGALHHNNIIQVLDTGDEGGLPYFAMEYIHGADIRTLLATLSRQKVRLPIEHAIAIVSTTAQALHYAHDATSPDGKPLSIVHRDVTPANILVSFDGNIKVGDFGIAKAAITLTTQVGVLKGRSPYMAPEQCQGQPVDRRSDVFALGIVLWEMLTMKRLYKGATDHEVMETIVNSAPPRPTTVYRYIPQELELVTLKALAKEPINRYQTAAELSTALEAIARSLGRSSTTSTLGAFVSKQLGSRPEPWLVVSDRVAKRPSVDFDSDEPSKDEIEPDTKTDLPAAPPVAAKAEDAEEPTTADGVLVAPELEHMVERGDTENDAIANSPSTTKTAMPPPIPKQKKGKGEPTQIVTPLDVERSRPSLKRTLLVGASGSIVAVLIVIVAAKLVSSSDTSAASLDTAKQVEPAPVVPPQAQPTTPPPAADPAPAPAQPTPAADPGSAANGGYASHPGTVVPEAPREGPGLGDFSKVEPPKPRPEIEKTDAPKVAAKAEPPPPEPVKVEPPKPEPKKIEAKVEPKPEPKPEVVKKPEVKKPVAAVEPKPAPKKPVAVAKKPPTQPAKKPVATPPKAKYDPDSLFLKVPK